MPYGLNYTRGFRRLIDAQMQYVRNGHPTWLRLRNFPDLQNQQFAQLGFSISPTGTNAVGTTDIAVSPWPSMTYVSVHSIGMSMGKLRLGARTFIISHTFVLALMQRFGITDPSQAEAVWRNPAVVGLYSDTQLHSIEDIRHEEIAGDTIVWRIVTNSLEVK